MTSKYLILGAQGQLGSELRSQLDDAQHEGSDISYVQADYEECDLSDPSQVAGFFARHNDVAVVFNTAAYTDVDNAEEHGDLAMKVNGLAAGYVAAASRDIGAKLIHFSTDFVFGDGHKEPIAESVRPEPLSVYGETKRMGEVMALQNHDACAVVRTSGLYSRWGGNFVRSIAHYARDKGHLKVVDDQFVGPTPASTLAEVALAMAEAPLFTGGIYHATVQGACTWADFAKVIVDELGIEATIETTTAEKWGAAARRPKYSILDNRLLRLRGLDHFGSWEEELRTFLDEYGDRL